MVTIRETHKWSKYRVYVTMKFPSLPYIYNTTPTLKAPGTSRKQRWKYSKRLKTRRSGRAVSTDVVETISYQERKRKAW